MTLTILKLPLLQFALQQRLWLNLQTSFSTILGQLNQGVQIRHLHPPYFVLMFEKTTAIFINLHTAL